jgi:hypothetical protein
MLRSEFLRKMSSVPGRHVVFEFDAIIALSVVRPNGTSGAFQ